MCFVLLKKMIPQSRCVRLSACAHIASANSTADRSGCAMLHTAESALGGLVVEARWVLPLAASVRRLNPASEKSEGDWLTELSMLARGAQHSQTSPGRGANLILRWRTLSLPQCVARRLAFFRCFFRRLLTRARLDQCRWHLFTGIG